MKILLVEDDPELARQVLMWLRAAGHAPVWRERGSEALAAVQDEVFTAVILDVGLPDMNGFAVVGRLRQAGHQMPVLFLTARDSVTDRVRGLQGGGDDYLTKPFATEELLARLEALHRRASQSGAAPVLKLGPWTLDSKKHRLRNGDEVVDLQPRECLLLETFMSHEGRILTKKFLLEKVWELHFDPGSNVVDVAISKLRGKIDEPGRPSHIRNVRGKGYAFESLPR
jgi:DNA-binding response OmpR family regulator